MDTLYNKYYHNCFINIYTENCYCIVWNCYYIKKTKKYFKN